MPLLTIPYSEGAKSSFFSFFISLIDRISQPFIACSKNSNLGLLLDPTILVARELVGYISHIVASNGFEP